MAPRQLSGEISLFDVMNSRIPDMKQEDYDFLFGPTKNELSFNICKGKCQ